MTRADEMVLKFREVLKETECLGPDDLWEYQKSLLTPLLLHARTHSPFYEKRLDAVFNGDEIDFDRWPEIPILTRAEALKQRMSIRAKMVPPHLGPTFEDETSGSMGKPMRFFMSELSNIAALSTMDRLYRWWDFDGLKPMATFISPRRKISKPEGTTTHGWRSGYLEGLTHMRQSSFDMESNVEWLNEVKPDYVVAFSSMLRPMAEIAIERGIKLKFDRVISYGGVVDRDLWPLCRKAFGAELVDQYGANETGQIACQCRKCGNYHVNSELMLVELLDNSGEPVEPGDTGRIVVTTFYNFAMPFIRYEIGDYAQLVPAEPDCDVKLPSLSRVNGRYRNNFILRDGRIIFPNPPMSELRKILFHTQVQIVQTSFERIEYRYVPANPGTPIDLARLQQWTGEQFGEAFRAEAIAVEPIAANPSGKFEDVISMVGSGR